MSDETKTRGLGRGLSALLGDEDDDYTALERLPSAKEVPIEFVQPNPNQPRRRFAAEALASLVDSVREHGILQPILVRRLADHENRYQIVAGERRWRAAQEAKLHQVPVMIRDVNDAELVEVALVENIQREDLTPIEEAEAYRRLIGEFGHTQERLGQVVGKSRSHIANSLRLLTLPDPVKAMVEDSALSAGHARALLAAAEPEARAREVVAKGLNVRQTERLVQEPAKAKSAAPPPVKDVNTAALEADLSAALGFKVVIQDRIVRGQLKGGVVQIAYETLEQLDEVCRRLCHHPPPD